MDKKTFLKVVEKTRTELEDVLKESAAANEILKESLEELDALIEEVEIDPQILNLPKFKGQTVFEKYVEAALGKGKIKDKSKIAGLVKTNEVLSAQRDINRLKEIVK